MADVISTIRTRDQTAAGLRKAEARVRRFRDNVRATTRGVVAGNIISSGFYRALDKAQAEMRKAFDFQVNIEQSQAQLESMFLGPASAVTARAKDLQAEAKAYARQTAFSFEEATRATTFLLSYTSDIDLTRDMLLKTGDAAAVMGTDFVEASRWIGRALSKIRAGVAFGEERERLREIGVLSGGASMELERLAGAGDKLGAERFLREDVFERFEGGAERMRSTLGGVVQQIQGLTTEYLALKGSGFFEAFKGIGERYVGGIQAAIAAEEAARGPGGPEMAAREVAAYIRTAEGMERLQHAIEELIRHGGMTRVQAQSEAMRLLRGEFQGRYEAAAGAGPPSPGATVRPQPPVPQTLTAAQEREVARLERIEMAKDRAVYQHRKRLFEKRVAEEQGKQLAVIAHIQQRREQAAQIVHDKRMALIDHERQRREMVAQQEEGKALAIIAHEKQRRESAAAAATAEVDRIRGIYEGIGDRVGETVYQAMFTEGTFTDKMRTAFQALGVDLGRILAEQISRQLLAGQISRAVGGAVAGGAAGAGGGAAVGGAASGLGGAIAGGVGMGTALATAGITFGVSLAVGGLFSWLSGRGGGDRERQDRRTRERCRSETYVAWTGRGEFGMVAGRQPVVVRVESVLDGERTSRGIGRAALEA